MKERGLVAPRSRGDDEAIIEHIFGKQVLHLATERIPE